MTRIQIRKYELIAESESLRRECRSASADLQHSVRWLDSLVVLLRTYRPMLRLAAPFAGYLAARKWRMRVRLLRRGRWLWKLTRALFRENRNRARSPDV